MANEQTRKKSKRSWAGFSRWFFVGLAMLCGSAFILWTLRANEAPADTRRLALAMVGCCAVVGLGMLFRAMSLTPSSADDLS